MQTFLPYPNFLCSAHVLDNRRLGNQCYRETLTLFKGKWANHPVSKAWKGYEGALALYGFSLAQEMENRRIWKKEITDKWKAFWQNEVRKLGYEMPKWIGNKDFHASHRSNLLRKGICDKTYEIYKNKAVKLGLPIKKSLWTHDHFSFVWEKLGKPKRESTHYGVFGWTEPDNLPYIWPTV